LRPKKDGGATKKKRKKGIMDKKKKWVSWSENASLKPVGKSVGGTGNKIRVGVKINSSQGWVFLLLACD